jgi:hypothetical protein
MPRNFFAACFLSVLVGNASAQVTVPVNDQAAVNFYKNSQLVLSQATVNPFELAGCLILSKDGQIDQYINVMPDAIRKTLKPQNLTDSVYRTMLTREQAVKVGFLGAFGISTTEKALLEIAISNRWKLEAPSLWSDETLKKTALEIGKVYAAQGYKVSYNQNVQYSTLVSSEFQESSGEIKSAFSYIDGTGKRFVQSANYTQREIIATAPFDIMPLIRAWNPKSATASEFKINDTLREAVLASGSSYEKAVRKLDSADLGALKANAREISAGEFKTRLLK